jgi:nucleoside-triphosphatase
MPKRILLITGSPGTGKTTLLLKIIETVKQNGHRIGGMISREVRSDGTRVGFQIADLDTGTNGWLAHVNQNTGPQIGKYRVNLNDLNKIGAEAIIKAVEHCDLIAIDEIGLMELLSEKFVTSVRKAVESSKPIIATVHWKARNKLIDEIKARNDAQTYTITLENRETVHNTLTEKIKEFLSTKATG